MDEALLKEQVIKALEDSRYKWRTPKGIAKQLSLKEEEVLSVLSENQDVIVQSSVPSKRGEPLYTTRKHFHSKSNFMDKILGAFKGRVR